MAGVVDAFSTAWQMLDALRERRISARELLELHCSRITLLNPRITAVVTWDFERARLRADALDSGAGTESLRGLPVTFKDCIDVQGLPTTAGDPERAAALPVHDAAITARVRRAGAVILGKTNVSPYAADWQSNNGLFGRTLNPWDVTRTPGGSTGGGAAAVAAGFTPLEFGSDLAGSIRIPAAFCGVYGHRPSETAVPRTGHVPGSNTPNPAVNMSVMGPLARSARDLSLAMEVLIGPDVGEDVAWHIRLPRARHLELTNFRVAFLPAVEWMPVDGSIRSACEGLRIALERAGSLVGEVMPEFEGGLREYYRTFLTLLWATAGSRMPAATRTRLAQRFQSSGDDLLQARAAGLTAGVSEYIDVYARRESHRAAYRHFFSQWDVLVAPANMVNAFHHTDAPFSQRTFRVAGQSVAYDDQGFYPSLASLAGHPATVFPAGQSAGLPVGLQVIGPYLEDRTPIRFAALLADILGGFVPPAAFVEAPPITDSTRGQS